MTEIEPTVELHQPAGLWKSKPDWDFEAGEGGFRDSGGRRVPVFAVAPEKVLAFGKGVYSQTRHSFSA
jgi:hypothetical protein